MFPMSIGKTSRDPRRANVSKFCGGTRRSVSCGGRGDMVEAVAAVSAKRRRRAWRAGIVWRLDPSGRGLGPDIRNIARGYGHRPAIGAPAASARKAGTAAGGRLTGTHGAGACAGASARGHCAVPISVRRSDAHHRSRHRPQQGAGDGPVASQWFSPLALDRDAGRGVGYRVVDHLELAQYEIWMAQMASRCRALRRSKTKAAS